MVWGFEGGIGDLWSVEGISDAWHMVSWVVGAALAIRVPWPEEVGVRVRGTGI